MRRMHSILPALALLLAFTLPLGGCGAALRSAYTPPKATIPDRWDAGAANGTAADSGAISDANLGAALDTSVNATVIDAASWPAAFGDPRLTRLVGLALERNNDLAAAAVRVRQARITAGLAREDQWPDLSATGSSDHQKVLSRGDGWTNTYSASLGVSYEADLWGKLARTYDAAQWEAVATEEDRRSTALTLVGTTMKLYWQIAYGNVRLSLSAQNIESAEKTLELVRVQDRTGAASSLEVREAEQDLASLRADHQTLIQERRENINALAILFDMPPGEVVADPQRLPDRAPPAVPAGLPAALLGRRPDLQAAELRLRKLLADTDAARAGFYPTLTLTGSLGGSSDELAHVLENPVAALASSLALPFLNWNTLHLNLELSKAQYDEAVVNFRQTLYTAMQDVENALSARRTLTARGDLLAENLVAAREVERIYEVRYRSGYVALKDWLDAQKTRRTAEQSLAENLLDRLTNAVTLYQALGGEPVAPQS